MALLTSSNWSRAWCVALICAATALWMGMARAAPRLTGTEAEIRATYMYNFALFTRWPTNSFASTNSPILVAVIGADPIGPELERLAAGVTVRGRKLQVTLLPSGSNAPECHILFVAASEKDRVRELLAQVAGKPVLTVSELDPFCRIGGCVRFGRADRSVTLYFNPKEAAAQGLRLSPELLAIGRIRETERNVEPK
jgi:hypothetical protein